VRAPMKWPLVKSFRRCSCCQVLTRSNWPTTRMQVRLGRNYHICRFPCEGWTRIGHGKPQESQTVRACRAFSLDQVWLTPLLRDALETEFILQPPRQAESWVLAPPPPRGFFFACMRSLRPFAKVKKAFSKLQLATRTLRSASPPPLGCGRGRAPPWVHRYEPGGGVPDIAKVTVVVGEGQSLRAAPVWQLCASSTQLVSNSNIVGQASEYLICVERTSLD
jgi:hypothetical protein